MVSEPKVQEHWEIGLCLRCGRRRPQCDDLAMRVSCVESLPGNVEGQVACPVGGCLWYMMISLEGRLRICGPWFDGMIVGVPTQVSHCKNRQRLP